MKNGKNGSDGVVLLPGLPFSVDFELVNDLIKYYEAISAGDHFSVDGNRSAASRACEQALVQFPTSNRALNGLGKAALAANHVDFAIENFLWSLKIDPVNSEALDYLCRITEAFLIHGQFDKSGEVWREAFYIVMGYISKCKNDLALKILKFLSEKQQRRAMLAHRLGRRPERFPLDPPDAPIRIATIYDEPKSQNNAQKLADEIDIEIVGVAAIEEDLQMIREFDPDILLLDVNFSRDNAASAVEKLSRQVPSAQIIPLSEYDEIDFLRRLMVAGVREILFKPYDPPELVNRIRRVFLIDSDRYKRRADDS